MDHQTQAPHKAFAATMNDLLLLNEAKARQLDVELITGEQIDKILARAVKAMPPVVERIKAALQEQDTITFFWHTKPIPIFFTSKVLMVA